MSKARLIGTGLVVLAVGAGGALLPIDGEFSDFGFGISGRVTIECGSAFADEVIIRGDSSISNFDRVFIDGDNGDESAVEFCDRKRSSYRLVAIIGLLVGALLFLGGLFWPNPPPPPSPRRFVPPPQGRPAAGGHPPSSEPPQRQQSHPAAPSPSAGAERVSGGSRGSGTPIDPAAAQPGTPAAPVPPAQREVVDPEMPGSGGGAWWYQPLDGTLPDATPLPHRGDGPIADSSLPVAPAAPIPDSVVGSLPPSPVSGRTVPSVDPTPAATPAPIPDALSTGGADGDSFRAPSSQTESAERIEQFQLSDGQLLLVDDVSVVGRSPSPPISYPDAVLVTVEDRTVSKSHAAFGRTAGELWVEDLHSRNGLVVIRQDGTRQPSPPGETTPLAVGDAVRLGDHTTLTVTTGAPPADASTQRRPG